MEKYVIFYNPDSRRYEMDTLRNFKEIRIYTCARTGLKFSEFIIRFERYCSKHMLIKFEQKKNRLNSLLV